MSALENECEYATLRARQESDAALNSASKDAAAAHRTLSKLYHSRARALLLDAQHAKAGPDAASGAAIFGAVEPSARKIDERR